jgi:hypothetical protein
MARKSMFKHAIMHQSAAGRRAIKLRCLVVTAYEPRATGSASHAAANAWLMGCCNLCIAAARMHGYTCCSNDARVEVIPQEHH